MAVGHISYNSSTQHGSLLRNTMINLDSAMKNLADLVAPGGTMSLMIDGDGSQAAHFTYMTTKFGFASDAVAKAAWEELNAVYAKLSTDAGVTNVHAAIVQALGKFR